MSLNKLAVGASANAGHVGGGGTGNDEQNKASVLAVSNADKLRRWYVFDEMHHLSVVNANDDASGNNTLTYPRRIEGLVTQSPGLRLLGASIFIEDAYWSSGTSTGDFMQVHMRKSTSDVPAPTTSEGDGWSYVIRPTNISADTAVMSESFVDLPIESPFIQANEFWYLEFKLVDRDLLPITPGTAQQGWGVTILNLHWASQLKT